MPSRACRTRRYGEGMTRSRFRLPLSLFGIPIRLDATFLLLVALLTWSIGARVGAYVDLFGLNVDPAPLERGLTPWLLGLASASGLVVSVLIHELAHALVARRFGVEIREIRLWILGGIAQFSEMPRQPRAEALVAIAGPIASVLLGLGFGAVLTLIPSSAGAASVVVSYLAAVNVALAAFNLLPALPMDGGRVLRSLLATRLDRLRATRIAAAVSRLLAVAMGLFGLWSLNLFLVAIAFFVWIAVQAETQHETVQRALEGVHVRDLMTADVETVPATMTSQAFVQHVFEHKHVFYPVIDLSGRVIGTVRLQDAGGHDPDTPITQLMTREMRTIGPDDAAADAFTRIQEAHARRLLVTDENESVVGVLSTTDLLRAVQIRMMGLDVDATGGRDGGP